MPDHGIAMLFLNDGHCFRNSKAQYNPSPLQEEGQRLPALHEACGSK